MRLACPRRRDRAGAGAGERGPGGAKDAGVIDKVKLALRGTREQRSVLVRDANKVVAVSVMGSPKLNSTEVEAFAKMASVQEEVLRIIGSNRHWVKNYPIAAVLVGNSKTHSASPWGS